MFVCLFIASSISRHPDTTTNIFLCINFCMWNLTVTELCKYVNFFNLGGCIFLSVYCSSQLYSINLHFEGCIDSLNLKYASWWKVLTHWKGVGKVPWTQSIDHVLEGNQLSPRSGLAHRGQLKLKQALQYSQDWHCDLWGAMEAMILLVLGFPGGSVVKNPLPMWRLRFDA